MLTLDFLGVAFAWAMHVGVQMPDVGAPVIGVAAGQPKRLEQCFELQKDLVFAATKDVGQDFTSVVIDGACQSQRGLPLLPTNDHISSISASASPVRSRFQATSSGFSVRSTAVFTDSSTGAFFLSSRSTVLGQICSERAVSRTPLALRLMLITPLRKGHSRF